MGDEDKIDDKVTVSIFEDGKRDDRKLWKGKS